MKNGIEKLAESIVYPEEVPAGAKSYIFAVDDFDVKAAVEAGRIILSGTVYTPPKDDSGEEMLVKLSEYAAGRILKEEAVLAWDPDSDSVILWQEFPEKAELPDLRRFFEVFTASLEWWRDRAATEEEVQPTLPEFVIMP